MYYGQINVDDNNKNKENKMTPDKFIKGLGLAILSYIVIIAVFIPYILFVSFLIERLFSFDIPILNWFLDYTFINAGTAHWMSLMFGMSIIYYLFKRILRFLKINDDKIIKTAVITVIIYSTFSFLIGIIGMKKISPTDLFIIIVFSFILHKLFNNTYTLQKQE